MTSSRKISIEKRKSRKAEVQRSKKKSFQMTEDIAVFFLPWANSNMDHLINN